MPQNSVPSFAELIAGCHRSAVHLEMRDAYGVAEEAADFAAWKRGQPAVWAGQEWLDLVGETVGRGVVMRRARIVSQPVSDYIRYEHAGTYLNVEAGELIRWLSRRLASDLALPGNDFWVFDDRLIRFGHFTGDGAFAGHELCDEPAVVKLCSTAFDAVWERATPHERFTI